MNPGDAFAVAANTMNEKHPDIICLLVHVHDITSEVLSPKSDQP